MECLIIGLNLRLELIPRMSLVTLFLYETYLQETYMELNIAGTEYCRQNEELLKHSTPLVFFYTP